MNQSPTAAVIFALLLLTVGTHWKVTSWEFVNYDDDAYVSANPYLKLGSAREKISWALRTTETGNRHPLTWFSHMLDLVLFGENPGAHHTTSLILHAVNVVLLFVLLRFMTGSVWRSAAVAALFGLHPINVESVAWISQRKNLLSTQFWFLTIFAYCQYVRRPNFSRSAVVFFLFGLGLLAKPMLVTLPLTLLLLDIWPLGRVSFLSNGNVGGEPFPLHLILEKLPLLALSVAASIWTLIAQQAAGAVRSLDAVPLGMRIANALVSYVRYLWKLIWPADYAVLYPFPDQVSGVMMIAAAVLLAGITYLAVISTRRYPYLAVGWLWYLGTLFPVIGLIQAGAQAMADRYAYVPAVGLLVLVVWGAADLAARWKLRMLPLAVSAAAVLGVLALSTCQQVKTWENSITLFSHALDVTTRNYTAHNNLGIALLDAGRIEEAVAHFEAVLKIKPRYKKAFNNIGAALAKQRKWSEAVAYYERALEIDPAYADALFNRGSAWMMMDRLDLSIRDLSRALELSPGDPTVYNSLGIAHYRSGNLNDAVYLFREAVRRSPDYADAHNNLGVAMTTLGRPAEAVWHLRLALDIDHRHSDAAENLEKAREASDQLRDEIDTLARAFSSNPKNAGLLAAIGNLQERAGDLAAATDSYRNAVAIRPDWIPALDGLAILLSKQGQYAEAIALFGRILILEPNNAEACYKIAALCALQHRTEEAINWIKRAIDNGFEDWERLKKDRNMDSIREHLLTNRLRSRECETG